MKKIIVRLKNKYVIAALVIVVLISILWYRSSHRASGFDVAEAQIGNVIETVSVTGVISPSAQADLAFQKGGVLSKVYVKVNDTVKRGQIIAALSVGSERAALSSAEATLADMSRMLTPEELEVQKAALASAKASYEDAEMDSLDAAHEAYVKVQGALVNYVDQFFTNPQSVNPKIIFNTASYTEESSINTGKIIISEILVKWSENLSAPNANAREIVLQSRDYLATIKDFMKNLSLIVNRLSVGNSGYTQAQLDTYKQSMNSGLAALDSAVSVISVAETTLTTKRSALLEAQSSYNLKISGNSAESIAAQAAKVSQAQAAVSEGLVISPIDGIVTKADPNEGEFVAAGQAGFAVQNSSYKIEAFVPEADIAKISVGDTASSTLDAYGADVDFPARVIAINPAETVKEGVPTYKVTLEFVNHDERIRSGMTANLTILTNEIDNVLKIPYRAIIDKDGKKSVRKVDVTGKEYLEVPVNIGLKSSDGFIQITSGLRAGDKVVTYVKQ